MCAGRAGGEASLGAREEGGPVWICLIVARFLQWPLGSCCLLPDDRELRDMLAPLDQPLSLSALTQARPAHLPFSFVYFWMCKASWEVSRQVEPNIS